MVLKNCEKKLAAYNYENNFIKLKIITLKNLYYFTIFAIVNKILIIKKCRKLILNILIF